MELLTAAEMRRVEQIAIESGAVTGLELMERAGRGVVEAVLDWRPELRSGAQRAVVLCGPGNNGGDGFVVARLLHARGWNVEVFFHGGDAGLPTDAATNAARWRTLGPIESLTAEALATSEAERSLRPRLVVDAVFGTGLKRPVAGPGLDALNFAAATGGFAHAPWVCIDVLSGICADSGRDLGAPSVHPGDVLTVAFHRLKCGHVLADGATRSGTLKRVDIGLDAIFEAQRPTTSQILAGLVSPEVPKADLCSAPEPSPTRLLDATPGPSLAEGVRKHEDQHKYDNGHALVLSGGPGQGGAARLAARGALRVGAGLVTIGCPPAALIENAARLDAIMLRSLKDLPALVDLLNDDRINALCLGPGMGLNDRTRGMVIEALGTGRTMVLDADALTAFEGEPAALFDALHPGAVLTPHDGEFRRLFPDIGERLRTPATAGPAYSKIDAAREAASRSGCTVLYKGADTVIADPSGQAAVNAAHQDRAAPWLATGGSGDVLAGFITGLLARGFEPMHAAETGAWLHVECARRFGPGLIAEDLPEALPGVFRDLGV
ncbi:MAG: NAD(P)H-hydrate dehydratase [Pseudomonadota bacterium]